MRRFYKTIILLLLITINCFSYEIVVCSIFKNEARFLSEWIEYHKRIGVDHFYLFDDSSSDDFMNCLKPYIEEKLVTVFSSSELFPNISTWTMQILAEEYYLKKFGQETKWCAYIDIDEFLVLKRHDNMEDFLKEFQDDIGSIYVRWQCFGTSNIHKVPDGELLEHLTMKALPEDEINFVGKSIVKTQSQVGMNGPHHARLKPGYFQTNCDLSLIQLNHYFCRDQVFFYNTRVRFRRNPAVFKKGFSNKDVENRFNAVFDDSIRRFL